MTSELEHSTTSSQCVVTQHRRMLVIRRTQCRALGLLLVVLLSFACAQADLHAPCMGCRLFNLQHRLHPDQDKKETNFCHYPCQCPYEELVCHEGVSTVKDGCGCCYMCARQIGDMCSKRDLCDSVKELFCDQKNENSTGTCKGKSKNPCFVAGATYQDGEKFQPKCSQLCTCQNGFYGCVNTCPQELQKPSELTCHEPKLIKVPNKCCREWTCQKMEASGSSSLADIRGLESQNLVFQNPHWYAPSSEASVTPAIPLDTSPQPCHKKTTDWTPCSVSCGVGVSMRIVVDPEKCSSYNEHQLCYIRPCQENVATLGRSRCTPTTRTDGKQHIRYQDCISVKAYKLKFCTNCKKNKCCYPRRTKTKTMEFQCSDGEREVMKYMWIKTCRCDKVCYKKDERSREGRRRGGRKRGKRWRERRRRRRRRRRFQIKMN